MEVDEFDGEAHKRTPTAGVKTLDSQTASQLRTSQVIVKISDVVRELVENSVDAEATTIKVLLEKHGLDKIEVRDDGQGISSEGIGVVFKGGYTSKLESTTNLNRSKWLGFRGEALNAICASGNVSVISKTSDAPASKYELDALGNVISVSTVSLNRGTVITVTNMFEKTPVRRQVNQDAKVLARELKEIETYLKGVGIANPKCYISLIHNGSLLWSKPTVNTIDQALIAVLGHSTAKKLKKCGPVKVMKDIDDKERLIEMYLPAKPVDMRTMSFTSNQLAMIFCNRKRVYIREYEKLIHRYITSVVDKPQPADQRRFPVSFLCINVPPGEVDFNRDMDKTKVFLVHKDAIYDALEEALATFYEIDLRKTDSQQPQDSTSNSTGAVCKSANQTGEAANQACVDNLVTSAKATPLNNLSAEGRKSAISEFLQDIPQNSDAFTKSPVKPPNSEPVAVTFPTSKPVSQTETGILRNATNLGARDATTSEISMDEERRRLPEVVSNFEIDLDFLDDVTQIQPSCVGKDSVAGEAVLSKEMQISKQNYDDWLEGRMLDKNGEIIQNVVVVNQPPTLPDKERDMERFRLALTAGKRQASTSCSSPFEPFNKRSRMYFYSPHSRLANSAPSTPRIPSLSTPTHRQVTLHSLSKWPTPTSVFSQAASNAVAGVRLPMTPISYRISQDSAHATPNRRAENIAKSIELFEKQQLIGPNPSPMEVNGNPTPDQYLGIDRLVTPAQGLQPISSDWPAVTHHLKTCSTDRLPSKINGKIESDSSAGPLYFAQTQDSIGIFSPRNMIYYFPSECGLNKASSLDDISFSEDDVSALFSRFISAAEVNQASAVSSKIYHVLRTVASLKILERETV